MQERKDELNELRKMVQQELKELTGDTDAFANGSRAALNEVLSMIWEVRSEMYYLGNKA